MYMKMNRKLSLPAGLALAPNEDKIIAEGTYSRKISLALQNESRKSENIETISEKVDKTEKPERDEKPNRHGIRRRHSFNDREKDLNAPEDHYRVVKIMLFIVGLVHSLPMSFFGTANEYWMYKFRDPTSNSTNANDRTYLQANFNSLSHLVSMGPSTIASILITFYSHKIKAKSRVLFTLTTQSIIFALQTAFVKIDTDDWQYVFFWITVILMTTLSCSGSLGTAGHMIIVSQFPEHYMKFYLIGESVSAMFTSVMRLISIVCAPSTTGAALIYFVTGTVIVFFTDILFYFTTKMEYFRYYTKDMKEGTKRRVPRFREFKEIIGYTKYFIILMTTIMLFPAMSLTSLVVSEYYGTDSVWGNKYFVTCTTYLLSSVCGIIGRVLFYKFEIELSIPTMFVVFITRELVYAPLMYMVNAKPRKHLPVLLPHDWQYALIIGTHAISGGYLFNTVTLKQMRSVPPDKLELSWLVQFFIMKLVGLVGSPMGVLAVSLL